MIREVQTCLPRLPAILLTGYVGEAMSLDLDGLIDSQTFALLRKPIDGSMLANRAATLLEGVVSSS